MNMIPLATPFSPPDIGTGRIASVPAIKIASPDMVNRPLLQAAAQLGKPLMVSTGAAECEEVDTTVWLARRVEIHFALLHCVSAYPTPADQAHLCWIGELANRFDVPVGYSDHTTDSALRRVLGGGGCDGRSSGISPTTAPPKGPIMPPAAIQHNSSDYVRYIREAEVLRGSAGKRVLEIEADVRKVSRQSLVARHTLEAGAVLKEEDLTVQRPGTGLPASEIVKAIGRRVNKAVPAGTLMQWDMLDAA